MLCYDSVGMHGQVGYGSYNQLWQDKMLILKTIKVVLILEFMIKLMFGMFITYLLKWIYKESRDILYLLQVAIAKYM